MSLRRQLSQKKQSVFIPELLYLNNAIELLYPLCPILVNRCPVQ
jgi:hypothetical protein